MTAAIIICIMLGLIFGAGLAFGAIIHFGHPVTEHPVRVLVVVTPERPQPESNRSTLLALPRSGRFYDSEV